MSRYREDIVIFAVRHFLTCNGKSAYRLGLGLLVLGLVVGAALFAQDVSLPVIGISRHARTNNRRNKTKQTTNRTAADGSLQTLITSYVYDGDGRITQTTHPYGSVSYTTYNSIGKVDYTRDALFRVTSFDYDDLGQKIGTTYPDGTTSATSYDANGNVLTNTDRAGRTTTYQYDDLDRQVKTIMPDGTYTQQVYDDEGGVTESYDENHHKTSYTYDDAGRQTHVKDALGHETITTYDDRDRQHTVEDVLHKITTFNYDDDGRLLSTVFDDGTSNSSVYDELGRVIQQTDQKGRVTKFAFDDLGHLVGVDQVMDASDSSKDLITTYAYDEVGNKILQVDAKSNRTSFAYDNMGRLIGRKLPGEQVEAMAYNSVGQLTTKTDFAGHTTHYAYDQRGRLIQKTPDASLGEATVSFSYPNELTKVSTRGSIQNIYKYDAARGWLNSVQTNNGTINYGYDAAGNRTKVRITGKDGGNRETDYAYDELNRVSTVSRTGMGTLANYTYDAIGNVSQVTRANGVTSTYGYDDLHRLTSIQHKQGTTILSQFNYALSADGKRNTLQEYLKYPAGQTVASVNRTVFYGYDNAGRLNAEQRQSTSTLTAGGTIANTARTLWTYDKVGNRLTQEVSNYDGIGVPGDSGATGVLKSTFNTSYTYNNNDWLTSTISVKEDDSGESTFNTNFEYNANGSQTAVTTNVGTSDEKRIPYFYDFEQKLTGIGDTSDTIRHVYAYDADGNRIAESNTSAGGTDIRNYLVDPNNSNAQIVEEYDGTGTLETHYDWNDAELLREASLDADTSSYVTHQPLADAQNSTRQLLDGTGAVSDVYAFDAWGNQQEAVGGAFNPYRYNSQRLDASGLYYLRARQYSSGIGRFLTHDPMMGDIHSPITQHRYLYAGDDAEDFADPSGNFAYTQKIGGEIEQALELEYVTTHASVAWFGDKQMFRGQGWIGPGTVLPYLKPDIFDATERRMMEIKPLSKGGIYEGATQLLKYQLAFGGPQVPPNNRFYPNVTWLFPGQLIQTSSSGPYYVINVGGVIYYTNVERQIEKLSAVTVAAALSDPAELRQIARLAVGTWESAMETISGLVSSSTMADSGRLQTTTGITLELSALGGAAAVL